MPISREKTFRNIVYSALTKGLTLICLALASSIIARNLTPEDYGVVGFAGIIISFLAHFSDMGVGSAIIRRPTIDDESLRTAFTLKVLLSCGAFAGALLIAPFAHYFFHHPQTGNVIRVLAIEFLTSIIGFLPLMMLTRELKYRTLMIPWLTNTVVRCSLVVTLILLGWKYWAVIIADVGATIGLGIAAQIARKIPVGFRFNWAESREYLKFGVPIFGSGVLVFLIFNMDNFLVGSLIGSSQLGYYALAFTWGSFICSILYDTVNNVMLPTFSAIQNDTAAMRRWYLKTVDLVAFVAVVANTALLANAHLFLVTFLGKGSDKWIPAALSLKILCIYGIIRAITEPIGNCILARGRTNTLLHSSVLVGTLELLLLFMVLRLGRIELVAAAVLIAYISQAIIYLPFLRRHFSIGIGDIVAQLWPTIPAIVGGCLITSLLPASIGSTILTLGVRGLFTAVVVALIHGICTRFRCFQEAGGMISQNLARVRA